MLTGLAAASVGSAALPLRQQFVLIDKSPAAAPYSDPATRRATSRGLRLYESGLLRLDEMVTRRYRLDEINGAYADLVAGELIRGVIDFSIG